MLDCGVNISWQKLYGHSNPSVADWSPCPCQEGPRAAERIPFTDVLPPHKCFLCPMYKINAEDFIPWFTSWDTIWHVLPSDVFFNKNQPLTPDDMNSWVGLWLGHTLPKAGGWAHWLSFEQPCFQVLLTQLWAQPKFISSQVLLDKKTLKNLACFKPVEHSSRIMDLLRNFNH